MSTPSVAEMMERAAAGDQEAWNGLVTQFERLVWSVIRGFHLDEATTRDVSQTVWLRFVENLGKIRQPDAVGSWLATTARHESIRVSQARRRLVPVDFEYDFEDVGSPSPVERLIDADDHAEVLDAFSRLSDACQELLRLLISDPPLDYGTISAMTGRPVGAIGPTRGRCLDRLRQFMEAR